MIFVWNQARTKTIRGSSLSDTKHYTGCGLTIAIYGPCSNGPYFYMHMIVYQQFRGVGLISRRLRGPRSERRGNIQMN